ncbi:hypothetical protein ACFC18_37155, partial [Streptomyces sp. NPDC056121]|uniref:hypothetical protein n=1 Tax=Streptomyces sp. NPDC056121 TaxID=3345718 RepID=UPI0035E37519
MPSSSVVPTDRSASSPKPASHTATLSTYPAPAGYVPNCHSPPGTREPSGLVSRGSPSSSAKPNSVKR